MIPRPPSLTIALVGPLSAAGLVVGSYLLGTFPTASLVARGRGRDVLAEGSGNPGASNVYRLAGRRAGASVLAGDLVKGLVSTGVGLAVGGRHLALACGIAAVVGHCFPVTRRFRGGKGVATGAGMSIVAFPIIAAACAVAWLVVAKVTTKASLGSLAATVVLVIGVVVARRPAWEIAGVVGVVLLIVGRHRSNLARLARGEERSLQ
ncbi:MAG: acyl phosphate:glycerol-3-phosphate acyltransferase [Actinomycetota bacterium]|jgi:glycerol-3-phosphate acyltransferase PlsY|nr:acyl phosphate:glycerol-3-phosphate acyltransferase [Actinomycetota bacterium]